MKGLTMTVGTVIGFLASCYTAEAVLKMCPYPQQEDIMEALSYGAWRLEDIEVPLAGKTRLSDYKQKLANISVWTDDDLKVFDEVIKH